MSTALVSWVMVYTPGQLYVGFLLFSHNYLKFESCQFGQCHYSFQLNVETHFLPVKSATPTPVRDSDSLEFTGPPDERNISGSRMVKDGQGPKCL